MKTVKIRSHLKQQGFIDKRGFKDNVDTWVTTLAKVAEIIKQEREQPKKLCIIQVYYNIDEDTIQL